MISKAKKCGRVRKIFGDLKSDVLLTFGVSPDSADAILSARQYKVPIVFVVAADAELRSACSEGKAWCPGGRGSLARFCLENADYVIAQTETQRHMLTGALPDREVRLIRNPIDLMAIPQRTSSDGSTAVIWVGRSDKHHKRPAICLELATMLPSYSFLMIMNRECEEIYEDIVERAPRNVRVIERVSPTEMLQQLASAQLFISTSAAEEEGFPNVFLEAALVGTAIVSLEADPDGLLSEGPLGVCCQGDLYRMARTMESLLQDQHERKRLANKAAEYVQMNHDLGSQVTKLYEFLASICVA
ncbi:MAG TPA: glycosyltransferase family 4 protein [Pirellulales bacterium]|nr:glycosyltransferase family 4 protein [Pirellulales bacterium]